MCKYELKKKKEINYVMNVIKKLLSEIDSSL